MAEEKNNYFTKKVEDWDTVRYDYVHGVVDESTGKTTFPTLKELAEKYDVSPVTVRMQSMKGKWSRLKALVKSKLKERRDVSELRDVLSASASFDSSTLDAADKLFKLINAQLDEYVEELKSPKHDEESGNQRIDPKNIKMLTDSIARLNAMTRNLLGDDGSVQSIAAEIQQLEEEQREDSSSETKVNQLQSMLNEIRKARREMEG
jgi:hypothetical protein